MTEKIIIHDPAKLQELRSKKPWETISEAVGDYGKQVWQQATGAPDADRQQEVVTKGLDWAEDLPFLGGGLKLTGHKLAEAIKSAPAAAWQSKPVQAVRDTVDAFLSPHTILERSPVGAQLHQVIREASAKEQMFVAERLKKFIGLQKQTGIEKGTIGSQNVARALDGKIDPKQLSTEEHRVYEFLKGEFDWLINRRARQLAGSDEGYKRVAGWANAKHVPMANVKDMQDKNKNKYVGVVQQMWQVRQNRPFAQMSAAEQQEYKRLKGVAEKIRQVDWLQQLPAGEREAYVLLKRKIKEYLPHVFDKDMLLKEMQQEALVLEKKLRLLAPGKAQEQVKRRLKQVYDSLNSLQGGGLVSYEGLPQNVRFRFFEVRKGRPGYELDAVKAYETYLTGLSRKMYHEPALKEASELFKQLPPEQRDYARWFVENWHGQRKKVGEELANWMTSAQWMLKLGLNPRSAIYNLTQQLNTIAMVGEPAAARGYRLGLTKKGQEMFDKTGIAFEVPTVLVEGEVPKRLEKVKEIVGWMFSRTELANRKHAFLSGFEKAKMEGKSDAEAWRYGLEVVHRTQFLYGKIGTSRAASSAFGRPALQFTSYPIKQLEFLIHMARTNPTGLGRWLAYSHGIEYGMQQLGADLKAGLGFGIDWPEVVEAVKAVPDGDWDRMFRQLKLAYPGGGLIPSSPGPTVMAALDVVKASSQGRGFEEVLHQLTPVQLQKLQRAYKAVKEREVGAEGTKYPIFNRADARTMELTGRQLVSETFGPRTVVGVEAQKRYVEKTEKNKEYNRHMEGIVKALVEGDVEKAVKLMTKWGIFPTQEGIENEILRRALPAELRDQMETGKMREWREQRK